MADFVATIKLSIESATQEGGGTGAAGTGGGGGGAGGQIDLTPFIKTIQELRQEFTVLSAQVRSVAQSLEQIRNVSGASSGNTGAPSGVSGVDPGLVELLKALLETKSASKESAAAIDQETATKEKATKATKEQATAESDLGDIHAKATQHAKENKAASDAASEATKRTAKALRELEGETPRRSFKGKLNPIRQFEELALEAAKNPDVRKQAAKSIDEILDAIKIPKDATAEAVKAGERLSKNVESIITEIIGRIETGSATRKDIGRARQNIRSEVEFTKETIGTGAPTVDVDSIALALASKSLTTAVDRAQANVLRYSKSVEDGVDGQEIANRKSKALADVALANRSVISSSRTVFGTDRRTGQENVQGGAAFQAQLKAERLVGATQVPLTGVANQAFEGLKQSLSDLESPVQSVRRIIDGLVDGGQGLDNIRRSVQSFIDASKGLEQSDLLDKEGFPSREQFLNLQEIKKLLGSIKVGEGGDLRGGAGTISPQAATLAGQRAVERLRQQVFQDAQAAGPDQQAPIKRSIDLQVPIKGGGVRKVNVEVEALGKTLDSVRVKAKDLSDNMFDRTSVRAALQRVAVWSAAAGVVFGAVNAFRQGLSTLIDTESALVGLAKVTNESATNLEAFKDRAAAAASGIAREFGQPLEEVLETMILFGQQGKTLTETISLSRASALASSVTTLNQPEAASALTAATQQFGLEFSKAESIVDKFNEVANNAAVTETDLAQALKKAGQAARNAGLDLDEFNGVVAAIAEQTRQSGNEIGTALRFIFSRLQTPEAEKGLAQVGISARDTAGNIRAFTPIIEELAGKFDTLSNSQKTQVAISIAGTRRFNTLLALLDNFSRFQDSAANSTNSAGSALREQEQVVETAAFKIEQLKNQLKELALSFGDSLLSPLKLVVDSLGGLVGLLGAIPGPLKTLAAGTAIGSLAFLKFSDHITDFLGLAGSVGGAANVIGGSLRRNLTQGISEEGQISRFGADAFNTTSAATITARAVPDLTNPFKKNAAGVTAFSAALNKSKLSLVTSRGEALKSSAAFGKFGATVRGFSTTAGKDLGVTALALSGLNSGLTRFIAFFGILANKITSTIPLVAGAFEGLDIATANTNSRALGLLGTFGRFAVAGGVIYGLVVAFNALRDAAFESAEEVEKELQPELAKRQEALVAVQKQLQAVKALTDERRRAASVRSPQPFERLAPSQEQDVLSGGFRSATVAIRKLRQEEQEASNQIGFANPELIDSIDEFGNVVLSSAGAFDVLTDSAGNAQNALLGLTQVNIIGAFSDELREETGLIAGALNSIDDALGTISLGGIIDDDIGTTQLTRFKESLNSFKSVLNDPIVRQARELNVDVETLSPGKAKQLRERGQSFSEESLGIRGVIETTKAKTRDLTRDSGELVFQTLASKNRAALEAEVSLLSTQGIETSVEALLNQAFLQNRSVLKDVRDAISDAPALTIGELRESGRAPTFLNIDDSVEAGKRDLEKIRSELLNFSGGEFILFDNIEGVSRQAVVQVTATGKRQIQFIGDEFGNFATESLEEALQKSFGEVQFIDPDKVKRQLTSALQEIGRVVSGAGRGGILGQDLELGVNLRSELSGQQRAAQGDELLFSEIRAAQEALSTFRGSFGAEDEAGGESTSKITDPENVARVAELAEAVDKLATAARIKVQIEEVAIAFEKAADTIKNSRIEDAISAQFSGAIGAASGAIKRDFEKPLLPGDVPAVAASDALSNDIVALANTLSRLDKATGDFVAGNEVAQRNIETFVRDFEAAGIAGGTRDPNRVSDLARQSAALNKTGLDKAESILVSINDKQLSEQQQTNSLLAHIDANLLDNPRAVGAAFANETKNLQGDTEGLRAVAAAIEARGDKVSGFSPQDLQELVSSIPAALIPTVVQEFKASQASGAARGLTTSLLTVGNTDLADRQLAEKLTRSPEGRIKFLNATSNTDFAADTLVESVAKLEAAIAKDGGSDTQRTITALASEIDTGVTDALESALSSAFTDEQFSQIAANPNRLGETSVGDERVQEVLQVGIDKLLAQGSESIKKVGERLQETLDKGGAGAADLLDVTRKAIEQTIDVGAPAPQKEAARVFKLTAAEGKNLTAAMSATASATTALFNSAKLATGVFLNLKDGITTTLEGIQTATKQALDEITVARATEQFTTPQVGLLAGVRLPATAVDARRNISELSGSELTSLESPELPRGLNEVNIAFDALVGQLVKVKQEQTRAQRALGDFRAEGNVRGINLAKEALTQLGGLSILVEGQINTAQGTLKEFGESFRNIEAVNQLRVDVEKLVDSFDKEIKLKFDRTSIATALGNTVFSATRPTFEQFSQGQEGFLTKFERTLAGIDFEERAGTITSREADTAREKNVFERDEDVIALAQGRENEKLQAAVSAAEQIRSRLLDFVASGAPGTEAAQSLLNQITTELEQAGDIIPGSGRSASIRDPRTGREVDVPASQVNTFRGLPGLGNVTQQLAALSQQVTEGEAQSNAELITKPLLTTLDKIPTKLDDIVSALKEAGDLDEAAATTDVATGATDVLREVNRILAPLSKANFAGDTAISGAASTTIVTGLNNIAQINSNTLARLLEILPVTSPDGTTQKLGEFISSLGTLLTERGLSDASNIDAQVAAVFERAAGAATTPLLGATESFATASSTFSTGLDELNTKMSGESGLAGGITKVVDALSAFKSKLDAIKDFFGGSGVQKRAQGGMITGPGGPTSDKVPVLASPGEFVINARAASQIGIRQLNELNGTTSSTIGPDSAASGATLAFQRGGLVDPTDLFEKQQKALAENNRRALEEEAQALGARKLRVKLEELEATRTILYSGDNAGSEAAKRHQKKIDDVNKQLAFVKNKTIKDQEKRTAQLAKLEAARAQGVTVGEDGSVVVPDEALGKTAKQLRQEERSRRSKAAEREGTFQPGPSGKSFARLSEDGQRLAFDSDPSGGGVDVANLVGVSTTDKEEFAAEVQRRQAALKAIENAEANRQAKKDELSRDFLVGQIAKEEATPTEEQDAYGRSYARLQDLLRVKTNMTVDRVVQAFNTSNSSLTTAQEVTTTRVNDLTGSEVSEFADSLDSKIIEVKNINELLQMSKKQNVQLAQPPNYELLGDPQLPVRAEFTPPAVGIRSLDDGFKPFANGFVFNDNPQTQGLVSQYAQARLLPSLEQAQVELRDANKVRGRTKQFVAQVGEGANTAILDAAEFYQDKTDSELLKDLIGGTAGQIAGVTKLGVSAVGFGADVAGGLGAGDFDARKLKDLRPVDIIKGSVALSEGVIGVGEHLYTNTVDVVGRNADLYEQLDNTQDPAERKRIRRQLVDAQSDLFGAAVEVGTVLQPLSLLKGKLPPITPRGKRIKFAKQDALKHTSPRTAIQALKEQKLLELDGKKAGSKGASRTARENSKALRERVDFLKEQDKLKNAALAKNLGREPTFAEKLSTEGQTASQVKQRAQALSRRADIDARQANRTRPPSIEDQVASSLARTPLGPTVGEAFTAVRDRFRRTPDTTDPKPTRTEKKTARDAETAQKRAAAQEEARRDALGIAPATSAEAKAILRKEAKDTAKLQAEAEALAPGAAGPQRLGLLGKLGVGTGGTGGLIGGAFGAQALGFTASSLGSLGGISKALLIGGGGAGLGAFAAFKLIQGLKGLSRRVPTGPRGPTLTDRIFGAFSGRRGRGGGGRGGRGGGDGIIGEADLGPLVPRERGFATGLEGVIGEGDLGALIPREGLLDLGIPSPAAIPRRLDDALGLSVDDFGGLPVGDPRFTGSGALSLREAGAALPQRLTPGGGPRADLVKLATEGGPDVLDDFIDQARTQQRVAEEAATVRRLADESAVPRPVVEPGGFSRAELQQRSLLEAGFTLDKNGRLRAPKGGTDLLLDSGDLKPVKGGRFVNESEALRSLELRSRRKVETSDLFERTRARAREVELEQQAIPEFIEPTPAPTLAQRVDFDLARQEAAALRRAELEAQAVPEFIEPELSALQLERDAIPRFIDDATPIDRTITGPIDPTATVPGVPSARGKGKRGLRGQREEPFDLAKFTAELEARAPGLGTPIKDPSRLGPAPFQDPLIGPTGLPSQEAIRQNLLKAPAGSQTIAQRQAAEAARLAQETRAVTAQIRVPDAVRSTKPRPSFEAAPEALEEVFKLPPGELTFDSRLADTLDEVAFSTTAPTTRVGKTPLLRPEADLLPAELEARLAAKAARDKARADKLQRATLEDLKAFEIQALEGGDVVANSAELAAAKFVAENNQLKGSGVFGLRPSDPRALAKFNVAVVDRAPTRITDSIRRREGFDTTADVDEALLGIFKPGNVVDQTLIARKQIEAGLDLATPLPSNMTVAELQAYISKEKAVAQFTKTIPEDVGIYEQALENRAIAAKRAENTAAHEINHAVGSDRPDKGGVLISKTGENARVNIPDVQAELQKIQSFTKGRQNQDLAAPGGGLSVEELRPSLPKFKDILFTDEGKGLNASFAGGDEALLSSIAETPLTTANARIQNAAKLKLLVEHARGTKKIAPERLGPYLETVHEDWLYNAAEGSFPARSAALKRKHGLEYDTSIPAAEIDKLTVPEVSIFDKDIELARFRSGGKITGPGGPTSDRVPILASAGEFVLNADSVGRLGLPAVESMNRTGKLPKFQTGGLIGDDEFESAQRELRGGPRLLSREEVFGTRGGLPAAILGGGGIARSSLPADPTLVTARQDFEQAKQRLTDAEALAERRAANTALERRAASGLVTQREANAQFQAGAAAGLISQREANARFSEGAASALLEAQGGATPDNSFTGNRGRGNRLQSQADLLELEGLRGGGGITGPGGPRSDSILARLSDGEFVISAASADKLGLPLLEELNNTGRLPGFQDGGDVSGRSSNGASVTVNTDEIASAISQAIVAASSEASISIDTGEAATVISNAVAAALSSITFPDVKLDTSSLDSVNLGNNLGAGVKDKLTAIDGSIEGVRRDTSEGVSALRAELVLQEQRLTDKFGHKENVDNDNSQRASAASVLVVDREVKIIKQELLRLENSLRKTTTTASIAQSEALKK